MKKRPLKGILESLLSGVASAASYCPTQQVLAHKLPAYLIADQLSPLPDTLQSLINHISPLLMFPHRSVQIAAFHILRRYTPNLLAELYQNVITSMEYTYHGALSFWLFFLKIKPQLQNKFLICFLVVDPLLKIHLI